MTRIIRVKKTAMRILNPDLDYENCLLANHIPLIDEYWPAVPNHYQTILLNAAHTLHKNIVLGCHQQYKQIPLRWTEMKC